MNILVINCGSSSLKYQLIDMNGENVLCKGLVERIGLEGSRIKHDTTGKERAVIEAAMPNHKVALELVLKALVDENHGAVKSMTEINAVGHRVVHGGETFSASVVIDEEVMKVLNECVELAPLHNPPNIIGIEACQELMPNVPMVAVFDTAFHQTMEPVSYIYSLPYEYYEKHKIRRYGFHGTSHKYVAGRTAELLGKDINELNMINCHLGNGSSVCAIKNGKAIDTTMGFTPLEGLTMGTRSGDMDPAIIPFLMEKEGLTTEQINNVLNKQSGVLGISGLSSDFRDLEVAEEQGNERAKLALDIFANKVKKYIGSYMAILGRVDAIVFTAGVGENSGDMRARICEGMEALGVSINKEANNVRGIEAKVNNESSSVAIFVVPTNEEVMIARDTLALTSK